MCQEAYTATKPESCPLLTLCRPDIEKKFKARLRPLSALAQSSQSQTRSIPSMLPFIICACCLWSWLFLLHRLHYHHRHIAPQYRSEGHLCGCAPPSLQPQTSPPCSLEGPHHTSQPLANHWPSHANSKGASLKPFPPAPFTHPTPM